ncbi:MAG: hypothetical protein PHS14_08945 [Elusimicrobia bacterium]|nr:hypothetical protein [Elusimicrobiota bacterium]
MKRLWPLPVLLLLALPLLAQEGDEAASSSASDSAPAQDSAIQEPAGQAEAPANADAPTSEDAPVAEPNAAENQPSQDGSEGGGSGDKAVKEEPLVSVKVVPSPNEEGDEESVAPAAPRKKVVPTATLIKAPRKGKPSAVKGAKLPKGKKGAKAEQASPAAEKAKAPAVPAEPPPPPVPAVPLTPITPRNP